MNLLQIVGSHPLIFRFWTALGLLCITLSPVFLFREQMLQLVCMLPFCLTGVLLYGLAWRMRYTSFMRERRAWMGNALGNSFVSIFTTAVTMLRSVEQREIGAHILVAVFVFCLMEIAKPIFDFGILQFFLRLPVVTSISCLLRSHESGDAPVLICLVLFSSAILFSGTFWQPNFLTAFVASIDEPQDEIRDDSSVPIVSEFTDSLSESLLVRDEVLGVGGPSQQAAAGVDESLGGGGGASQHGTGIDGV